MRLFSLEPIRRYRCAWLKQVFTQIQSDNDRGHAAATDTLAIVVDETAARVHPLVRHQFPGSCFHFAYRSASRKTGLIDSPVYLFQ